MEQPKEIHALAGTSGISPEDLAVQKAYKSQKDAMKAKIKELVADQIEVKLQRKTLYFPLEMKRTMPASQAQVTHVLNRIDLRHMYLAYGIHRGRTIKDIEGMDPNLRIDFAGKGQHLNPVNLDLIGKILAEYGSKNVHFSEGRSE